MSKEYYSMFGYDERHSPNVAANVTAEEAKQIAKAKSLNGMLLAPQVPGDGNHITYTRNNEGKYEVVRMHVWLTANLTKCTGAEVLGTDANA